MLDVRVLGLATISADVTPELARATIASLTVLGRCTPAPPSRPPWQTASNSRFRRHHAPPAPTPTEPSSGRRHRPSTRGPAPSPKPACKL